MPWAPLPVPRGGNWSLFPVKQHPLPFDAGTFRSRMIWHERFQRDTSHIWVRKRVEEAFARWAQD